MSCGCKTSGDSSHSCGTKSANGCENVNTCGNSYKLSVFDWLSNINNPSQSQTDFVEVRFKNDRKFFYKNVHNLPLHMGSVVTVESSPGHDIGVVSLTGELVKIQMKKKNFSEDNPLKIYRLANQKDIEVWHESRAKEEAVKIQARKISYALNLDMKITDVEFQGDGAKVTFYYTSDSRVDFRQLIKEYASTFRTKIDMKQIGFRQEAAKVGGIGSCGRELCCSTWLTDFRSVNTNAARYQQLSINPQKLAGQCGKLKCCLNYELDSYLDALSDFPSSSTTIDTVNGKAFCIKIDVFKKRMWFAYVDRSMAWYDLDVQDVKKLIAQNKKGEKALPLEELRTQHDIPMKSVDLIQENNMDRFEKKNRNSGKNQNRKKPNSPKNNPNQRLEQKATPGPSERRNVSEKKQQPNAKSQNPNQQPKKFKKKPQPKRDDNA
ncbi:MAG: hypothetical protein J6D35_05720 [Chryseobacterium sp.]|nr:hypothetical protein [Chryseobacterium sp.]